MTGGPLTATPPGSGRVLLVDVGTVVGEPGSPRHPCSRQHLMRTGLHGQARPCAAGPAAEQTCSCQGRGRGHRKCPHAPSTQREPREPLGASEQGDRWPCPCGLTGRPSFPFCTDRLPRQDR